MESDEQNKQINWKRTDRYREQTDNCQRIGKMRGWMKDVKELRSTGWYLQNGQRAEDYNIGNRVNNIISMHGVTWVFEISGDHSIST